jgi:hypothetical protein
MTLLVALLVAGLANAAEPEEEKKRELTPQELQIQADLAVKEEEMMRQLDAAKMRDLAKKAAADAAEQERLAKEEAKRRAAETEHSARIRAKKAKIQAMIGDQVDLESDMFDRADRNQKALTRGLLGAHRTAEDRHGDSAIGARQTPKQAPERDLPRAIFDEERVTIEARTWGNKKRLKLLRLKLDADRNKSPEIDRYLEPKTEEVVHQEEDRNYDGRMDVWKDYEDGKLVRRSVDESDDGKPDLWQVYENGLMVENQADRNYDGVIDAFYLYSTDHLLEEKHDADNDGRVDLIIKFKDGYREQAEEDRDRNGRFDTWTFYTLSDGKEMVTRIEIDKRGGGYADTFEYFEISGENSILARREEDHNGDGKIDMISVFIEGRLVRREIHNPDVVQL